MKKFFKAKQLIKSMVQNDYLPGIYKKAAAKGEVDPKKVIFADAHSNGLTENMIPVARALKKRGYSVKVMCKDIGMMNMIDAMSFMRQFMMEYATSGMIFISSYFLPVSSCEKRPETKVIQLWHSGGLLKKMGYDTADDIPEYYKGDVTKNYDLVTVSAPVCEPVWEQALRLSPGTAVSTGIARTDTLMDRRWQERCREKFFKEHNEALGRKVALYAPSFSGNAADPQCAAMSTGQDKVLYELGDDWYTIVMPHPLMRTGKDSVNTMELLPVVDLLITDYSSIVFDYAVYRKPFVLYCPDIEQFRTERGFYKDPESFPCRLITEPEELKECILSSDYDIDPKEYDAFWKEYMGSCDGHSAERIVDAAVRL